MPGISKPRAPQTPAPGSAPIRPPGGSVKKPTTGRRSAPARPNTTPTPPAQRLSPLAQQMMQRKLQQMAAQPVVRPPGLAAPAPAAQQRPAPQMQTRPAPVAIGQTPQAFPGLNVTDITPNTQNNFAPSGVPQADPRGLFGPQGRLAEAGAAINAPTWQNFPAPNAVEQVTAARYGQAPPPGAGVRQNEDGSEDWVTTGPNGQNVYTPKTRTTQANLAQKGFRALGQVVGMGLEALSLPAKGVERVLGSATQRTAQFTQPVLLPNGTTYAPPTNPTQASGMAVSASGPKYFYSGNTLVDAALQSYGDTGPVRDAISETTRIAYSGPEAQLRAIGRIVEYGQHPDQALYGDGAYINEHLVQLGYLDDKLKAIKADPLANYVYESWKANGYTDEQFIETLETSGLPGEQHMPSELVGQIVLDPLNVVSELAHPLLEADRVAAATKIFTTRTNRTAEEIAAGLARGMTPTGVELIDKGLNFFFGRTPTAVRNQIVTAGGDALSAGLRFADEGVKGSRFNVLKALYDFAEAAPTRLEGQSDEAFRLATEAWRSTHKLAESILQEKAPVMLSDAGKLGGALVRKLLQGQDGALNARLLKDLAESGKPPYQVMAELMSKLDDAATALLLPERAGANTVAEFVANTGKPAQAFPLFERGIAGAGEAVRAEKAAQAAKLNPANATIAPLLDYKASPLAHFLAGFDSVRNRINSGLWNIFATASPAYSARNALNNMVTAVADGNLTFESAGKVDEFLHILGDPTAAFKGIGSGEVATRAANPLKGGFSGFMRSTDIPVIGKGLKRLGVDIPLGAQAVEEAFSKRIVYTAAKRFLDRQMMLGKAIPEMPAALLSALGDDVARQVVQHIAGTYGDIDGALALAEKLRGGVSELWRIPADEHLAAVREFGGDLAQKLDTLLTGDEMKTADGIRAGFARLRRETAEQLKVAEQSIPSLTAMTGQVGAEFAEDTRLAVEAGVDPVRVTGVKPEDFEARLAAEQNAQAVAQGRAFEALKANPDKAGFEAFAQVQQEITEGGQKTSARLKELRQAAWDKTKSFRSMSGLTPDARGHMTDEVWRDYFARRDKLWSDFRRRAIEKWDGLTVAAGMELAPVGTAAATEAVGDSATQMAEYYAQAEREVQAELLGASGAGNFEQVRTIKPNGSLTKQNDIVAFDWHDPRWGYQGNNKNRWYVNVDTGTVEPPKIWVNETGAYQWERPAGKGKFGANVVTAKNGETWKLLPANEVDGWVERFGEAAGYDVGSPDFNWQVIEADLVNHIANGGGDQAREAMIDYYARRVMAGEKLPTYFRPSRTRNPEGYGARQLDVDAIMRRVEELGGTPPVRRGVQTSADAALMGKGVSNVTPVTGGPEVAVNTQGIPNFDIPGPTAVPQGGAGDALTLKMQGSLGQGPQIVMGGGGIGDVNALRGTPMQIPRKWTPADPRSILSTLNDLEANTLNRLGQTRPVNFSDEQWQLLQDWFQATRAQTQQARVIAGQVGSEARNFALLNYGDKRNFDAGLGVIYPYHYWYGRTYANWMKRAVLNPGMMAAYGRYRQALDTMHAALPEYYRQQLSTDDLGLDLETPLMFNLEQTMSPLYGLLGSDFTDPARRRAQLFGMQGFGAYVEDAGALGPTPWAPIAWATALSSYMGGDKDAGNAWMNNYLGTLPRAVRALTAQAGIGPAGGVNLDPQMFVANLMSGNGPSVQGMTQWERQRVATIIAGYGDNPPQGVDPEDWKAQVEEAAYTQSGPLWDKAMQEMFVGTAPAVLTSYFAGLGFKGRSETEAEVGQVYAEVARLRANYANMTPEEIQQAYIDLQRRNPIYELLMLSRAQGPQRDDAWVWEAMGRVGIGDREAWQAAGVSETALDAFFKTKTTEGMNPDLLNELLAGANTINARNRPVSIEEQQRQLDAKIAYDQLNKRLEAQFPAEAFTLEDEFFRIRDAQGAEAANAWLENLEPTRQALLRGMWDARTEAKLQAGPDVQRYYLDPERYEAMLVGQYYKQAEATRPGIQQLSSDYWDLRDSGDYGAAAMLLKEHPELKEYWDETAAFKNGVRAQVVKWLATLPPSTQGQERADFDPQGLNQDNLDQYYQTQTDARAGIYDSPYGQDGQAQSGAVSSTADAYRQRYEAEQAAKLAAQEGRQTYLTSQSKLDYGDALLAPLVDAYGPEGAAAYLEQPLAQAWPATTGGVAALVKLVGDQDSIRAALLANATTTKSATWAWYVGLLRNMTDEQLDALVKRYPQMADARIVAEQARAYEQPSLQSLHDILGFSVTFSEDGSYSLNKQSVKKNKKTGGYDLTTQGDGGATVSGFSGGSTSPRTYARFGGGGRGGGGGGGGTAIDAPDPETEGLANWMNFALKLKDEQPQMLTWLMDFFDAPDEYTRNALIQRYPQLMALLKSLGAEKLAALSEGYYLWREDQAAAQAPTVNGRKTKGPQIIRYYQTRPSTTGLQ